MKLILTQKDIEAAVRAHVSSMLTMNAGTEMEIAFTATRGADGITAEIDINYLGLSALTLPEKAPETASALPMAQVEARLPAEPEPEIPNQPDVTEDVPAPPKTSGKSLFTNFL